MGSLCGVWIWNFRNGFCKADLSHFQNFPSVLAHSGSLLEDFLDSFLMSPLRSRAWTPAQVRTHLTLLAYRKWSLSCLLKAKRAYPTLEVLLCSSRAFPPLITPTTESTLQKIWEEFFKTKPKAFAFESHHFNLSYSLGPASAFVCGSVCHSAFLFPR